MLEDLYSLEICFFLSCHLGKVKKNINRPNKINSRKLEPATFSVKSLAVFTLLAVDPGPEVFTLTSDFSEEDTKSQVFGIQGKFMFWKITLPETNIASETCWLRDYFPFGMLTFQGIC